MTALVHMIRCLSERWLDGALTEFVQKPVREQVEVWL